MRRIASLAILILASTFSVAGQAVNTINTVAGGGAEPATATSAYLPQPYAAVRDTAGNTYISVPTLNTVFKVTTAGTLSAYAGNGSNGFSGDGGAATSAQLSYPQGLAIDGNGNLFIADRYNNRIRRVDALTHVITTVAGSEDPYSGGFSGNGGPATNARLDQPEAVAVDSNGNLFIADTYNGVVREVNATTQNISTYAGGGATFGCPSGPAANAGFNNLVGIAVDGSGNVFVADQNLQIVCKITTSQAISTYAGTLNSSGVPGQPNGDGGAATAAKLLLPTGLTTDTTGNLYIADSGNPKIRKVDTTANHIITTVAGIGLICTNAQEPACGDGGAATSAEFNFPEGVFFDSLGNLVVADTDNMRVRAIGIGTTPTIANLAGGGAGGEGGAGTSGILGLPQFVAVDSSENVYALEVNGERLRELNATTKNLSTFAGDGYGGATIDCSGGTCGAANNGDGGPATQARFVNPQGVVTDSSGNFYILDPAAEVVRVINTQTTQIIVAGVTIQPGDIATIAGNGTQCGTPGNPNTPPACGDTGQATKASLYYPYSLAVDSAGNVYIGDGGLNTVRVVDTKGTISTFAGTPGTACNTYLTTQCGDNGPATSATLNFPAGLVTFNSSGITQVYIADAGDNVIRVVDTESNTISPFAFNGLPTFGGDGGSRGSASMEGPSQLAVDSRGNLYVGGGSDNVVRRIDAGDLSVITVAGDVNNLDGGFSGDGGPSTQAMIGNYGLAIFNTTNQTDDLFISDSGSNRIRRVNLAPVAVQSGSFAPFGPSLAGSSGTSSQLMSFTNNGLDDLILTVTVAGSSAFVLPDSTAPAGPYVFQVSPLSSGEFLVTFNPPVGASGTLTATITVKTNDAAHPTFSFQVTGTVTPAATLNVTINPAGPTVPGNVYGSDSTSGTTIICPTSGCTASYPTGSTVELVATPNNGFAFQGWNVGNAPDAASCASDTTGICDFTITISGETIGANFAVAVAGSYNIAIVGYGNGSGTVTSTPAGISCTVTNGAAGTTGCAATFSTANAPKGVLLTSTGTAANGSVFVGYLGFCAAGTSAGTCTTIPSTTSIGAAFSGPPVAFAVGQVFLDAGNMIFVLDPTTGKPVQVLKNTLGTGQGITFDSVGNLYVALTSGYLGVFNNKAAGPTAFGDYTADSQAYSVVIDPFSNALVGEQFITGDEQPTLLQYAPGTSPTGPPTATYYPAFESSNPAAFWTEVLDSGDTVAYTVGSDTVKVFDLGEQIQHPDIIPNPALTTGEALYALRELPDDSLLVAASDKIIHMSQSGSILQSYKPGGGIGVGSAIFQNLNLDPDGVSFWTNDALSGLLYKINIGSGGVENGGGFQTNLGFTATVLSNGVGGIAIYGQPPSGGADLAVTMTAPTSVQQGANIVYNLTVVNNGPLAATGVTLTASIANSLPVGLSPTNCSSTAVNGNTNITCSLGNIPSGQSVPATFTMTPTVTSGTIVATASVAGAQPDPNLTNNTATASTTINSTQTFTLTVTESGAGSGTVVSTNPPDNIMCPTTCSASFNAGTVVTLSATPNSGSVFSGWSGACTNTSGTCTVTMSQAQGVTATFGTSSGGGLTFSSTTLLAGAVTVPYGADIQVTGGTPPYTFAATGLPTGFSIDATANSNAVAGHVLNNAPKTAGTFTFNVTVTDSTTPTPLTGSATVSLTIAAMPANTQPGLLKGQYAMLMRGYNEVTGAEEAIIGSLTFDGTGNITTGELDINSTTVGIQSGVAATGVYVIGSDNRGVMSITPAGQTTGIFAFSVGDVINGVATKADMTSFTDNTGSGDLFSATLQLQDPTSFNNNAFAGTYIYPSTGQDPQGFRASELGLTTLNNANAVTSGSADTNNDGFVGTISTITGTYTTPDSNGRSSLAITLNTTPSKTVVYAVNANEAIYMTLDARATNVLLTGTAVKQVSPGLFSNTSLAGPDVFSLTGGTAGGTSANIGLLTVTGGTTPAVNVTLDSNDGGTVTIGQALTGALSIAANGRGTMSPGGNNLIFYLTQPDTGFVMGTDSSVSFGPIERQTGAPFSATPFANDNLFFGSQEPVTGTESEFSGIAMIGASSSFTPLDDETHPGGDLFFDQSLGSFTYAVNASGHFTTTSATQGNLSGYMVSPYEAIFLDTTGPASDPAPSVHPHVVVAQSIPPQAMSGVTVAPTSLTFAAQTVGTTSAALTVTVTNNGTATVNFTGFTVTGTNPGDFGVPLPNMSGQCSPVGTLAAGANCTIGVLFTPAAAGARSATLNISDTVTGSPQTVALSGTGTAPLGTITISPTMLTFASQTVGTTSATQTVTVSNNGNVNVTFTSIATTGDFSGATTAQCPAIVVDAAPCTFQIAFKPTAAGTRTGAITFTDNATGSPQTVTLTGTAVNGPATVTVSPTSLTFASQTVGSTSPAQNVTVTNTGTGPVNFTSFSITGESSGSFALASSGTSPCNPIGTLAANTSCTIGVTFTPTATGEFTAILSIADNATGSPQLVSLNGTGNNSPVIITIPPGGSATGTATPGGTAYFGLQITGAPGVTGTVQFGCTPSSPTISCNVIPSSIVLTGKPIEIAFGVQTYCTGATNAGFAPSAPGSWPAGGIALLLLSLGLGGLAWAMQRNRRVALTFAVLMLVALGTAACGSLAKGPNGATPPGTYSLTLTTTFNGQTQTMPNFLTLVVQ
ncbi:MAG: choice-of-anchor D domain-containing protein [Candidatus Acidiferrales bacterium]